MTNNPETELNITEKDILIFYKGVLENQIYRKFNRDLSLKLDQLIDRIENE